MLRTIASKQPGRHFSVWALVVSTIASPMASMAAPPVQPLPPAHYQLGALGGVVAGLRQMMLVYRVQITVGAANVNSDTLRTVQRENISNIPARVPTDIDPKDQEALDLQMFDIVQAGTYSNPGDWQSVKNADGSVTYTSKWGSTITGKMDRGAIVITKNAGTITDTVATNVQQPALPAAEVFPTGPMVASNTNQAANGPVQAPNGQPLNLRPGANTPGAVMLPSDAQLAINNAMATYFSGLTHNIKGDNDKNGNAVAPIVQQGVALMYTTLLDSLVKAKLVGNGLIAMTPYQKDQFINTLKQQANALMPLYNNFINLQNQVDNVPGSTEGIRQKYAGFKAQAAQLEAQGNHAAAVAMLDNINGSLYDRYVKAREKFYGALAQNPVLAVQIDGQQYFQVITQPTNTMAGIDQFDQAAQGYIGQLQGQIDKIAQMDDLANMMELGGSLYSGAQATAAASGGDYTKSLILALQGTWDGTEAVFQYDKGRNDTALAILSAVPIFGLPFAAVQIYQEGSDYFMAVGTEQDMKDLMAVNGGSAVGQAQDIRDSAGNKFGMSVALLPAQIPQFLAALKLGKVAIKNLKGLKIAATGANAANDVKAVGNGLNVANDANAAAAGNVKVAGAAGDTTAATKVAGVAVASEDAAATAKLNALLTQNAQTGAVSNVQKEIQAARAAGMSESEIAKITDGFDPKGMALGNNMIAEDLMKARLQHLGYDVNMPRSDFNQIQAMSVRAGTNGAGLSQADVAWLQAKLNTDPNYLNKLPKTGYVTQPTANPFNGSIMPQEGFISGLQTAEDVNQLKSAFVKAGGKVPAPGATGVNVAGGLPPGAGDGTVKLNNPQQPFAGANDGTVKLNNPQQPFGNPNDATVKLNNPQQPFDPNKTQILSNPQNPFGTTPGGTPTVQMGPGATSPTVQMGPGSNTPTVLLPNGGAGAPQGTVLMPNGGVPQGTVMLPNGGVSTGSPTVMLPAGSQEGTVILKNPQAPFGTNPGGTPTVLLPNGGAGVPQGTVLMPNGGVPQGTVLMPNGGVPQGTVMMPNGAATAPTVQLPAGAAGPTSMRLPLNPQQIQQVGMMAFSTASRRAGASGPAAQVHVTSLGESSGPAFKVQVVNTSSTPLTLADEGIVVEPVSGGPVMTSAKSTIPPGAQVAETTVEGFCVERVKQPPADGQQYRVAAPDVQARFAPLTRVLQAASKVQSMGLLHPDSDAAGYFNSIRQWAIWSRQDNFDEKKFTEEFLNHTKKNVEAGNAKWSKDMDQAVRKVAPNRWKDIQQVLQEANKGKAANGAAMMLHAAPSPDTYARNAFEAIIDTETQRRLRLRVPAKSVHYLAA